MDQLPVPEPAGQLTRLQQKIRIMRMAVSGLIDGEGFIDQDSLLSEPFSQAKGIRGRWR